MAQPGLRRMETLCFIVSHDVEVAEDDKAEQPLPPGAKGGTFFPCDNIRTNLKITAVVTF